MQNPTLKQIAWAAAKETPRLFFKPLVGMYRFIVKLLIAAKPRD
ncbi:hypothetical protein [Leeia oryzae]|nr:hypothetical protein [Leeia oryzae]